ncbi:MAG: AMP-binding protein, partial [Clostridia bacterium]|nr:AMP-binding protein [Clostridia bacterium]
MENSLLSERLCHDYPGRLAVVGSGQNCTYEDLQKGILGLKNKLRTMGVKRGSRVALWSYNSANWLIAFFAIVRAGGTAVLVNYSMSSQDAAGLLRMTDTGFLLCGDNGETKKDPDAMAHLAALAGIPESRCMDIRPSVLDLGHTFREDTEVPEGPDESDENDTSFIIFTSGTTSQPKAVQISQRALTFDADAFNANIGTYAGRSICVAVPLFHILGLLMSYAYLCRGATVCLPANYKPDTLVREIDAYRISDMAAVGAIYLSLAEAEGFEENVVPNLHLCMIAGGMSTPV